VSLVLTLALAVAVPLAIAAFLLRGGARLFLTFMLIGVVVCLLSAYVNAYFMAGDVTDELDANIRLVPIVEETLKALPEHVRKVLLKKRPDIFEDFYDASVTAGFKTIDNKIYEGWSTKNDQSTIADLARELGIGIQFTGYVRRCIK